MAAFGAATALSWSCYIQGTICPWWPRWGVIRDELPRFHGGSIGISWISWKLGFFQHFFLAREKQGIFPPWFNHQKWVKQWNWCVKNGKHGDVARLRRLFYPRPTLPDIGKPSPNGFLLGSPEWIWVCSITGVCPSNRVVIDGYIPGGSALNFYIFSHKEWVNINQQFTFCPGFAGHKGGHSNFEVGLFQLFLVPNVFQHLPTFASSPFSDIFSQGLHSDSLDDWISKADGQAWVRSWHFLSTPRRIQQLCVPRSKLG